MTKKDRDILRQANKRYHELEKSGYANSSPAFVYYKNKMEDIHRSGASSGFTLSDVKGGKKAAIANKAKVVSAAKRFLKLPTANLEGAIENKKKTREGLKSWGKFDSEEAVDKYINTLDLVTDQIKAFGLKSPDDAYVFDDIAYAVRSGTHSPEEIAQFFNELQEQQDNPWFRVERETLTSQIELFFMK